MNKRLSVVVVAAGSGVRMGGEVAKQFLPLGKEVVLMCTLRNLFRIGSVSEIILVLSAEGMPLWDDLCRTYHFDIPHKVVLGGATRFESVRNGIQICDPACPYIAIHDAVRPNITAAMIDRLLDTASCHGSAIPVVPVVDTVRLVEEQEEGSKVLDRSLLRAVQTPQIFRSTLLLNAYRQSFSPSFTDDASVVEAAEGVVYLCEGAFDNIKLTHPSDLQWMQVVWNRKEDNNEN